MSHPERALADRALADRALVDEAMCGEAHAVEALVQRLTPAIQGQVADVLLRRAPASLRSLAREEVLDLVQVVLIDLFDDGWRELRKWDPARGGLLTYVRMLARTKAHDHLRKQGRRPWREQFSPEGDLEPWMPASRGAQGLPARVSARQLVARALDDVRRDLSAVGIQLLELLFEQQLDVDEVMEVVPLSRDAIYQWRCRLRRRLQTALRTLGVHEASAW